MVAGIVQSDLRIVEISVERITCGNAHNITIFRCGDVSKVFDGGMQVGGCLSISLQS